MGILDNQCFNDHVSYQRVMSYLYKITSWVGETCFQTDTLQYHDIQIRNISSTA